MFCSVLLPVRSQNKLTGIITQNVHFENFEQSYRIGVGNSVDTFCKVTETIFSANSRGILTMQQGGYRYASFNSSSDLMIITLIANLKL